MLFRSPELRKHLLSIKCTQLTVATLNRCDRTITKLLRNLFGIFSQFNLHFMFLSNLFSFQSSKRRNTNVHAHRTRSGWPQLYFYIITTCPLEHENGIGLCLWPEGQNVQLLCEARIMRLTHSPVTIDILTKTLISDTI